MIDQATIDRIMDAAQIVDVVSEFVTLRKRGVNYIGLCPFHDDKTPSFSVSPSKGVCKCFSCGKGGNVVHFIMEHEQLSYYEALKWLAKKYGIEIKERELTNEEKMAQNERESLFIVNQHACEYFQNILTNHIDGKSIGMAYFRNRGFRDDIIKKFQLGYCLSQKDAFAREALQKGFKKEYLLKTGLCYAKDDGSLVDRFWGRVIFPVHTLSGKVVAFGGRVLDSHTKGVKMKYVNSPESDIYKKSNELYGIYFAKQAIVKQDRCFLVEGYTDVISMHQSGIENVVASSGTALTSGQIKLIHRFTNNITVLYDGDLAGIHASVRGIDMLLEEGMNIKVVLLPDGEDPDSFARKHNATDYQQFINAHEVDFIRFKVNLLLQDAGNDPIKRATMIQDIVKSISVIPTPITQSVYIHECSQMLQIEERILMHELNKLIAQRLEKKEQQASIASRQQQRQQQYQQQYQNVAYSAPTENTGPTPPPITEIPAELSAEGMPQTPFPMPDEIPSEQIPSPTMPEYPSFIPQANREGFEFYEIEKQIMSLLFRYGERTIITDENGKAMTVIEYIAEDLSNDEIQFHNELHRTILAEALLHVHEQGFVAERYFLAHPQPAISMLTADLSSDRYQLSKYHARTQVIVKDEDRLHELVPHLMLDYKYALIKEDLKHTLLALRKPENASDEEKYKKIMAHYQSLNTIKNNLAKNLGDRPLSWN